jgi:hypothetical protein
MRTKLVILLGLLAVLMGGPAVAVAQDGTPVPTTGVAIERTDVRYFVPFGPAGLSPTLEVTQEVSGTCSELSLADIGRGDAWFCSEAETGTIYDPCFENTFGPPDGSATLACVSSPFAGEVVNFTTTEPLRREKEGAPDVPNASAAPPPGQVVPIAPAAAPGDPTADQTGDEMLAEVAIDPLSIPWAIELANGDRCGLLTGATAVVAGMRINYGCEGGGSIVGELDRSAAVWTANYYDEQALGTELVEVATVWT